LVLGSFFDHCFVPVMMRYEILGFHGGFRRNDQMVCFVSGFRF